MHFPTSSVKSSPQLKQAKAGSAPAPVDIAKDGIVLGINKHRNMETKIYMTKEDRLRHFYTIGQTGTGKTTLLKNMITQDIMAGEGVCMIDPHGSDIQDILAIIPKERYEDVIYFDPSYTDRPMALNMLEYERVTRSKKLSLSMNFLAFFRNFMARCRSQWGLCLSNISETRQCS